jgi:putative transposase
MSGRKRLRLDLSAYDVSGTVWHINTPTLNRQPSFRNPAMAEAVVKSLSFHCTKGGADLLLYCVMPDHVHAVIVIGSTDLISIMHGFKSYTTTLWRQRSGQKRLWQESFHDHGVRRSENVDELVKYITENPQRAGLVSDWQDYPWIGGSLFEAG